MRKVLAAVPPRVEYTLSPYGNTLQPILDAMATWGTAHRARPQARPTRRRPRAI